MQRALLTLSLAILVATPSSRSLAADGTARAEFFEQRIRPVLVESCYECHSATSKKVKGGLRVDGRAELLKGGETGPSILPGKADDSLLIAAISHKDKELAMPPKKAALPASVVADFRQWVNEGAFWPGQETAVAAKGDGFDLEQRKRQWPWIWETPRRQPLPKVARQDWPVSDADYFLLARLEAKQLAPAPRADDRTWLRRVSFALTGLPPSPVEIREFLADHSPTARARVVERLLASPHYGERWARHWMDLVRYAESRGHESDYIIPNAYHYRDYLIRAFNTDVPYDQFVREHLAGDLVAAPRVNPVTGGNESVLATGWAFLGEEVHSPVDIRQDECDRIDNKVDVLSKTFLGLTVACARCHDHKFDALTAKDYYALSGFVLGSSYRQVRFEAMEQNRAIATELAALRARSLKPVLAALGETLRPALKTVPAYLLAARESLLAPDGTNTLPSIAKRHSLDVVKLGLWRARLQTAATNTGHPLQFIAGAVSDREGEDATRLAKLHADAAAGCSGSLAKDTRVIVDFNDPAHQPWKADGPGFGEGPLPAGAIRWGADPTNPVLRVTRHGAATRDPFWNRLKTAPNNQNDPGSLAATSRAGQMVRTPTFTLQTGKLFYLIKGRAVAYAAVDSHILVEGPLHGRLVQKVDSGSAEAPRWIEHDLTPYVGHRTHVEFGPHGESGLEVLMVVEATEKASFVPGGAPWFPAAVPASLVALATSFQRDLGIAREALAKDQVQSSSDLPRIATLADWLASNVDLFTGPDSKAWEHAVAGYTQAVSGLQARVRWESRTAVAWFDGTGLDESVLVRGKPFRPGPVAPRSLPVAFHGAKPIAATASSGRLELAEQMVDPDNSLVARVIVNRVWHHLFGRGIVATVDNFGVLGERPTHPELLDHLAWQFVHEDHWSLKQLVRRLVLSSAYAMSSQPADSRAEEADPSNLLLHRMPVRRLEAEAIRDSLLAVSGRLNQSVGGVPVEVHLTEFVIGRGRPDKGGPLDGDGRRSLYTAARRNFLPTMMLAFDLPTPFSTVGRRNVTNVPAQSLALMNDELFHEQARVWADRMCREAGTDEPNARLRWLFETAYGRLPSTAELTACRDTLRELEPSNPAGGVGKESWVELCHALLNANDFIYLK